VSFSAPTEHQGKEETAEAAAAPTPHEQLLPTNPSTTGPPAALTAAQQVEPEAVAQPLQQVEDQPSLLQQIFGKFQFDVSDFHRAKEARVGSDDRYVAKEKPTQRHETMEQVQEIQNRPQREGKNEEKTGVSDNAFIHRRMSYIHHSHDSFNRRKEEKNRRQEREAAEKAAVQAAFLQKKIAADNAAASVLQAFCRASTWRAFPDKRKIYFEVVVYLAFEQALLIRKFALSSFLRRKYQHDPYISENVLRFFPSVGRSSLTINWKCKQVAQKIDQRLFIEAHKLLVTAMYDLQEFGEAIGTKEEDLLTMQLVRRDNEFYDQDNPFCSAPGCSRKPIRVCEWDKKSKICDRHQYHCVWDRDSQSLLFMSQHKMNIAYNNRKEHFWLTILTSLHQRLGAGESCMMKQLVLSKKTGAEKYQGNQLHLIQTILNRAWTVMVPDDVPSVEEAVRTCKDGVKIIIREGYYSWTHPVEVRKRVEVQGEKGVFLHGPWCFDEDSGHGKFDNITFISSCGKGLHVSGGRWHFTDCVFQGHGDGCSVVSCGGNSEVLMEQSMICGLKTEREVLHPLFCISAFDRSSVKMHATVIKDASGSGVRVSGSARVECIDCHLRDHSLSALKIDECCEVMIQNSLAHHNGSFLDAHFNPSMASYFDKTLGSSVQLYDNIIYGTMWASRHRPVYLLGKRGSKISIDKGDVFAENKFYPEEFTMPLASTLTGNEPLISNHVLSSSWKVLTGRDLAPQYVLERERWCECEGLKQSDTSLVLQNSECNQNFQHLVSTN